MSPQGQYSRDKKIESLEAAAAGFGEWLDDALNPPQRRAMTADLLAGLEEQARAHEQERARRAQANRDRRDANYVY